jgi:hypothetical protein
MAYAGAVVELGLPYLVTAGAVVDAPAPSAGAACAMPVAAKSDAVDDVAAAHAP